jgi:hypothetical protein
VLLDDAPHGGGIFSGGGQPGEDRPLLLIEKRFQLRAHRLGRAGLDLEYDAARHGSARP